MIVSVIMWMCILFLIVGVVIVANGVNKSEPAAHLAGGVAMALVSFVVLCGIGQYYSELEPRSYIIIKKIETKDSKFINVTNIENFSVVSDSMIYNPGDTVWLNKGAEK